MLSRTLLRWQVPVVDEGGEQQGTGAGTGGLPSIEPVLDEDTLDELSNIDSKVRAYQCCVLCFVHSTWY